MGFCASQVREAMDSGKPFTPLYTQPQTAPAWEANEASHETSAPAMAAHLAMRTAAVRAKQVRLTMPACLFACPLSNKQEQEPLLLLLLLYT